MPSTRRSFLKTLGIAGALPLVPGVGRALAQGAPGFQPPYKVLEIYLAGGASHRDSFWCDPNSTPGAPYTESSWPDAGTTLTGPDAYADQTYLNLHPPDAPIAYDGSDVGIGPCGSVLAGSALWNQTRVLAMRHDTPAHDAGRHIAITGWRSGRPRAAGLGAAVQASLGGPGHHAWVLSAGGALGATHPFLLTGAYGSANVPVQIPILAGAGILTMLGRGTPPRDAMVSYYDHQYRQGLMPVSETDPVRSLGYQAYEQALTGVHDAQGIANILSGFSYTPRGGSATQAIHTAGSEYKDNRTLLAIQLANYLLTQQGASYVGVVCPGVGTGYDAHTSVSWALHAHTINRNIANILDALVAANLSDTLVAIYSEFGRSNQLAYTNGGTTTGGTGHCASGYAAMLLGGPLNQCSVAGTLDAPGSGPQLASGGPMDEGFHPAQLQAALRHAAGIDPFDTAKGYDDNVKAECGLIDTADLESKVLGL